MEGGVQEADSARCRMQIAGSETENVRNRRNESGVKRLAFDLHYFDSNWRRHK